MQKPLQMQPYLSANGCITEVWQTQEGDQQLCFADVTVGSSQTGTAWICDCER
jgi:hypothetical protein